jgi:hypothetical protein
MMLLQGINLGTVKKGEHFCSQGITKADKKCAEELRQLRMKRLRG